MSRTSKTLGALELAAFMRFGPSLTSTSGEHGWAVTQIITKLRNPLSMGVRITRSPFNFSTAHVARLKSDESNKSARHV
jgi:hypothetical protein